MKERLLDWPEQPKPLDQGISRTGGALRGSNVRLGTLLDYSLRTDRASSMVPPTLKLPQGAGRCGGLNYSSYATLITWRTSLVIYTC